jgi:hypothetical protein
VNGNGNTGGDAASAATLDVVVGGDPPTPTATPAVSHTPTQTPTATPPGGCPAMADSGCTGGFAKGLLLLKADVPGKERLVAKLLKGPALAQGDLGNPLGAGEGGTGTAYALCVYGDGGSLAGGVLVDRAGDSCGGAPCWKSIGPPPNDPRGPGKGYRYRDALLASAGVLKLLYKGGDAGKSKALLVGKGPSLPTAIPAALQLSSQVTVQLRSSDGLCLTAELDQITQQSATVFRAK